jgi:hypothetical protein
MAVIDGLHLAISRDALPFGPPLGTACIVLEQIGQASATIVIPGEPAVTAGDTTQLNAERHGRIYQNPPPERSASTVART